MWVEVTRAVYDAIDGFVAPQSTPINQQVLLAGLRRCFSASLVPFAAGNMIPAASPLPSIIHTTEGIPRCLNSFRHKDSSDFPINSRLIVSTATGTAFFHDQHSVSQQSFLPPLPPRTSSFALRIAQYASTKPIVSCSTPAPFAATEQKKKLASRDEHTRLPERIYNDAVSLELRRITIVGSFACGGILSLLEGLNWVL